MKKSKVEIPCFCIGKGVINLFGENADNVKNIYWRHMKTR